MLRITIKSGKCHFCFCHWFGSCFKWFTYSYICSESIYNFRVKIRNIFRFSFLLRLIPLMQGLYDQSYPPYINPIWPEATLPKTASYLKKNILPPSLFIRRHFSIIFNDSTTVMCCLPLASTILTCIVYLFYNVGLLPRAECNCTSL